MDNTALPFSRSLAELDVATTLARFGADVLRAMAEGQPAIEVVAELAERHGLAIATDGRVEILREIS